MKMDSNEKINFLDFDIYSRRISFYYKHKEKFGTTFGFILTISYIVLSIIVFMIHLIKSIKKKDVTAYISSIYPEEIPSIEINSDIFYISFGLEHSKRLSKFIDETIYYPEVLLIDQIKENGEYINKSEQILNVERCNVEKFGEKYQHLLENDNVNNSYCLKDINGTLKGGFQFNEMSYIKINLYPCVNSTDNNNHCKPQNIINDHLQSAYFSLLIKDIGFSPFNYSFPTLPILQYFNTALSKSILKEYVVYFGIVEINTDVGYLSNKPKIETYLKYTRDFNTFYFKDNEQYSNKEIFSTKILLEDYIYHQKRTFTKMSQVLSDTGGYMQFISTIFAVIALLTKKFGLEQKLLNSLFNFNIKQRKMILSIEYKKKLDYNSSLKSRQNTFIPYEPRKSIISKRSRRDSVLILNENKRNNFATLKRSVTMQNQNKTRLNELSGSGSINILKDGSELFRKISKEKEDLNNRSKVNMIAKEDELDIQQMMKNKLITKPKRKQSNFNVLNNLELLDKGGRSTINFNIFDYYCFKRISKNKRSEIEIFNFGINFFKNQMDIINFFNIIVLTQIMLTQQADDKKQNFLNRTIELNMK
jgi:hypothetical protein